MSETKMTNPLSQNDLQQLLNKDFFVVFCEPVRVQILQVLLGGNNIDIQTLAKHFTQHRSVISRHLLIMEKADIVSVKKNGRHQIITLNGNQIVEKLEEILGKLKQVIKVCCP